MKTIHTYTEGAELAPPFVSISAHEDGTHSVTVRDIRRGIAQIELPAESLAAMALDILEYYNSLPAVTVSINGRKHRLAGLGDSISYERLCREAGIPEHRNPSCIYSLPETRSGTVTPRRRAPICDGAVFTVIVTGAA